MEQGEVMNVYCFSIVVAFAVFRCGGPVHPVPDPVPPTPSEDDTLDDCDSACENMKRLDCEEGKGSPGADEKYGTADDVSCSEVCKNAMSGIYGIPMSPVCVSKVDSCNEVGDCYK
jgi:hypothetical protein